MNNTSTNATDREMAEWERAAREDGTTACEMARHGWESAAGSAARTAARWATALQQERERRAARA